jgi:predicted peptidase
MDVINAYSVDESRIYLTGLSRGGFGTWEFAVSYPDLFAAIAPVCARGISGIERVKDIPVWNI